MSSESKLNELANIEVRPARRSFLKSGAALATGLIAPGVFLYQTAAARPADQPVDSSVRWGMLIDTNLLDEGDVDAAVTACNTEHGIRSTGRDDTDAQWIRKVTLRNRDNGDTRVLPMMCQHCEKPPCVDVCPTGASFKRADGIVLVNKHTCIGCRFCMMACPYKARSFIHEVTKDQLPVAPRGKGTVESCTMCVHRVDRDGENAVPACAEAMQRRGKNAIIFGNLNNPDSEIAKRIAALKTTQLRADMGLNPGVSYQGM